MTDPYSILGISPNASDDEVKAAYRDLARKYHPDSYQGNPLADLAGEKMKEINQAYDQIMNQRKSGGNANRQQSYSGNNYNRSGYGQGQRSYSGSSQFADIRRLINTGRVTQAEELLDGVPHHNRDAEWHFLKGSVQYSRGWLDDAYSNFSRACEMDPNNGEYRAAFNQLQWQRQTGRPQGYGMNTGYPAGGCSCCDVCAAMYCANCCCDCMT